MMKNPLVVFIALQVMDLVTTLAVLALGGREMNPLITHLMVVGPIAGLLISKGAVTSVAVAGAAFQKYRGIRLANFAFAGIVVWNLTIVARLAA